MVSFAVEGLTCRKIIVRAVLESGGGNGLNETIDSPHTKTLITTLNLRPKNHENIFTPLSFFSNFTVEYILQSKLLKYNSSLPSQQPFW